MKDYFDPFYTSQKESAFDKALKDRENFKEYLRIKKLLEDQEKKNKSGNNFEKNGITYNLPKGMTLEDVPELP